MLLNVVNIALCIVIVILGYLAYKKNKTVPALFIGIAFGIFGLSHILTVVGLGTSLMNFLIAIRTVAYLAVVLALFIMAQVK